MSNFLCNLSNIELELEIVRATKLLAAHTEALEELNRICEEKYGLTLNDLEEVQNNEHVKLLKLKEEYQSRINDAGLSAFESTLG